MAASAGLSGKTTTNHSARKTMVTCLTRNSVPETQIIELTGHINLQSLNSYKKHTTAKGNVSCFELIQKA